MAASRRQEWLWGAGASLSWLWCTSCISKETCGAKRGNCLGSLSPTCARFGMFFEDFLGFLFCLLLRVGISKEARTLYQAMGGPLVPSSGEEWVSKVIFKCRMLVARQTSPRGRTTPHESRLFDNTKGFPGQDIHIRTLWFLGTFVCWLFLISDILHK